MEHSGAHRARPHQPAAVTAALEYGAVGVLAFFAAKPQWNTTRRFTFAVLFTLAAGWIDEGIQALLPTRHDDLRDVGFNALAGVMALTAFGLIRWSADTQRLAVVLAVLAFIIRLPEMGRTSTALRPMPASAKVRDCAPARDALPLIAASLSPTQRVGSRGWRQRCRRHAQVWVRRGKSQ